jgi:hypothetical protein
MVEINTLVRLATKLRLTIQSSTTTRTTNHSGGSDCRSRGELCGRRDGPYGEPFGFN